LIDRERLAGLCAVSEGTVRHWVRQGIIERCNPAAPSGEKALFDLAVCLPRILSYIGEKRELTPRSGPMRRRGCGSWRPKRRGPSWTIGKPAGNRSFPSAWSHSYTGALSGEIWRPALSWLPEQTATQVTFASSRIHRLTSLACTILGSLQNISNRSPAMQIRS